MAIGVHDNYPPGYPGYSYPYGPQTAANPHPWPNSITVHPSVMEQMGADPTSKLAAAIERLATALETWGGTREGFGGF